ncbi:A/G-specific adenine glycosylase [Nitrosomonas sp. Nm51]|uniref:A/G-specific adenine glycosylase n=1 Tax=Nitrosomonas sp. Nm51 TaxID=133720 RepID=UPI0008C82B4D|nr:A/G-specific adenine glycosylase [Nitrosomonas sp. Nm51]SER56373.1 A/G-specific adenine glycosylase [Nitrosomonas sp. Nm51]
MRFIAEQLIPWQKTSGRHDLPWQHRSDPYAVWLSEIMLQQTQVNAVIPYYQRFIKRFPDIGSLARASVEDVLTYWSGLGYYSRARNLLRAASAVVREHRGVFPQSRDALQRLPGIGRSTAAAIVVFAHGKRDAILDGNVKRVFARFFGIDRYPGEPATLARLWQLAEKSLPLDGNPDDTRTYTQALMDLGSLICVRSKPLCCQCPLRAHCIAYTQNRVAQLPVPRPKKNLPEKETVFMIYRNGCKLLLEKRPENGIWGGLWCFPESDFHHDQLALENSSHPIMLPQFWHAFTHFKLLIRPRLQDVHANKVVSASLVWKKPAEVLALAIPVPVKKLIHQHFIS